MSSLFIILSSGISSRSFLFRLTSRSFTYCNNTFTASNLAWLYAMSWYKYVTVELGEWSLQSPIDSFLCLCNTFLRQYISKVPTLQCGGRTLAGFVLKYNRHRMGERVRLGKLLFVQRPVCQLVDRRLLQRRRSKSRLVRYFASLHRTCRDCFKVSRHFVCVFAASKQGDQSGCRQPNRKPANDAECIYGHDVSRKAVWCAIALALTCVMRDCSLSQSAQPRWKSNWWLHPFDFECCNGAAVRRSGIDGLGIGCDEGCDVTAISVIHGQDTKSVVESLHRFAALLGHCTRSIIVRRCHVVTYCLLGCKKPVIDFMAFPAVAVIPECLT